MKLLITGFDPFGGETINPAWEAVKLLPQTVDNVEENYRYQRYFTDPQRSL